MVHLLTFDISCLTLQSRNLFFEKAPITNLLSTQCDVLVLLVKKHSVNMFFKFFRKVSMLVVVCSTQHRKLFPFRRACGSRSNFRESLINENASHRRSLPPYISHQSGSTRFSIGPSFILYLFNSPLRIHIV